MFCIFCIVLFVYVIFMHSCYGSVTSLNGEPEPGVFVEAVGSGDGDCGFLQEESKTEQDGAYRIRGLQVKWGKTGHIMGLKVYSVR